MTEYSYPKALKKLRACINCHLIKTEDQFAKEGCDNCLNSVNKDTLLEKTTQNFKGMIAVTNPKHSWCARWLHKSSYIPGFYCIDILQEDLDEDEYEEEDY